MGEKMHKIILVIGGIRSGKSCFAEEKAEYYSPQPVYIATATALDGEMKERIDLHRLRRNDCYEVIEEPLDLCQPLSKLENRTVLIDCLTLNLSNRLLKKEKKLMKDDGLSPGKIIAEDEAYLQRIHEIIVKNNLKVIMVSNEVGEAPVAVNRLGRYFQDLQGRWNRVVAGFAQEVYMMRAGISSLIKKQSCFPFRLSAPSYVLPGGYIENTVYLLDKVVDIQVLLFDSPEHDPLLKGDTITTLAYLARDAGLTFSVHMPVNPKIFTVKSFEQRLAGACRHIETFQSLPVSSFTFHYDLPEGEVWERMQSGLIREVEEAYIRFFQELRQRFPASDFSLENTFTPISALDRVVSECGLSYCIDIGHLLVQARDVSEVLPRLEKASVIHFHGWEEKGGERKDHRAVCYRQEIFSMLESFRGVLTIENYHKLLLEKSIEVLKVYF